MLFTTELGTKKYPMKKLLTVLSALVFFSVAQAQTQDEVFNTVFKMEKRNFFSENMHLKTEEFDEFWNIYASFEDKRAELGNLRMSMLTEYVEKYQTLTNEDADRIIKKWLSIEKKDDKLRSKYYCKMKKAVGAKTSAHFVQLDDYIQTAIQFEILGELPFIGEFSH